MNGGKSGSHPARSQLPVPFLDQKQQVPSESAVQMWVHSLLLVKQLTCSSVSQCQSLSQSVTKGGPIGQSVRTQLNRFLWWVLLFRFFRPREPWVVCRKISTRDRIHIFTLGLFAFLSNPRSLPHRRTRPPRSHPVTGPALPKLCPIRDLAL